MRFLQITTTDGNTEFLNLEKIISIRARKSGDVTILMGAGLYWHALPDSLTVVNLPDVLEAVKTP